MFRVAVFYLLLATIARGYDFIAWPPIKWPPGEIRMDLELGDSPRSLSDGKTSWNAVAREALDIWNSQLREVNFTSFADNTRGDGDDVNQVFFSSRAYGYSLGPGVLAITTTWRIRSQRLEGDTIFNPSIPWDSYRGDLKFVIDLRRVAIHEFGHTLGLDHPDDAGQVVVALMNKFASDVDTLEDDDIRGIHALYYPPETRYTLNVTEVPEGSGRVVISPLPDANGTYAPGTRATLTAKPNPHFRFNFWEGDADQSSRIIRLRINQDENVVANFSTNAAPAITSPPRSRIALAGDTVVLQVRATGKALTYQWQLNGAAIPGATTPTLTLDEVTRADSGLYIVRVSSATGNTTSKPARLTVDGF